MSGSGLLDVRDADVAYGSTVVLKGVSLTLEHGEALAVLGANGAGKTTLMRTIAGSKTPSFGSVTFDGQDVTSMPAEDRTELGIALAPEGRGIFVSLTIEENLRLGATVLRRRLGANEARRRIAQQLDDVYEMFPILGERRRLKASNLSGGQQQMLAIGRSLMSEPRLLLLDEPCLGLAPKIGQEVYEILERLREHGQSLIVVEESSRRALEFVDRAIVIKVGRKVLEDRASAFQGDELLLEAYFGSVDGEGEPT